MVSLSLLTGATLATMATASSWTPKVCCNQTLRQNSSEPSIKYTSIEKKNNGQYAAKVKIDLPHHAQNQSLMVLEFSSPVPTVVCQGIDACANYTRNTHFDLVFDGFVPQPVAGNTSRLSTGPTNMHIVWATNNVTSKSVQYVASCNNVSAPQTSVIGPSYCWTESTNSSTPGANSTRPGTNGTGSGIIPPPHTGNGTNPGTMEENAANTVKSMSTLIVAASFSLALLM